MKPLDPVFLAWCAGFFDGEGSVCIQKHADRRSGEARERYQLHAMVYQTERAPLDEIREAFGGTVCKLKTRVYSLHLTSATGARFLESIRPYCRVKGPEIDIAMEFRSTMRSSGAKTLLSDEVLSERKRLRDNLIRFRHDKYARAKETA